MSLLQEDMNKPLKTERIIRENKRYFLDLKENRRGRYLRVRYIATHHFLLKLLHGDISIVIDLSFRQQQAYMMMGPHAQPPPQIALPAQGTYIVT